MKKILLFILIIAILYFGDYFFKKRLIDNFYPIPHDDTISSIDDSYGKIVTTYKNPHMHKNCCMVKKVYNKKKDDFEYQYTKLDSCNHNMIPAIKHHQMNLFIDGVNGWNNEMCRKPDDSKDKEYLGSCKKINFECKDFMTPSQCKKYGMEWSDKTCMTPYKKPFSIKDREVTYNNQTFKV